MHARHLLLLALVAGSFLASLAVMLSWQRADDAVPARVALIDPPAAPVVNDAAFAHAIAERLDDPEPQVRRSLSRTTCSTSAPAGSGSTCAEQAGDVRD